MNKTIFCALLFCMGYFVWMHFLSTPQNLADSDNYQRVNAQVHTFAGYHMNILEPYEGEFRIFSKKNYHFGQQAEISPLDLMVGWGEMTNPDIYQKIDFNQSNRFGYWRTNTTPPLPIPDLQRQMANMHIIPENATIARQLRRLDKDDLVYLKGQLVEVKDTTGWLWRSSLSREDTGNGACELMLVSEVRQIS